MNDLLLLFLSLSFSGSLLALFLFAVKPLLKSRLSQTWQYYIWLIVVLRLLLPLTPQTSLIDGITHYLQSAASPPAVTEISPQRSDLPPEQMALSPAALPMPTTDEAAANFSPAGTAGTLTVHWQDVVNYAWLPWLVVALALFSHRLINYHRFVRLVKGSAEKATDTEMLHIYQRELTAAKYRRPLPLYGNDQITSPMLVGILHPVVILPALKVSNDELRHIFRHELIHGRRLDFLYQWLVQLALCLHWFNPLVYLMNKEIRRLCELSCDETVIRHLDQDERMTYGDALMATVTAPSSSSRTVLSLTMSEDADLVKERLDMIMKHQKKSPLAIGITVLFTILLFFGFTFTGAYAAHGNASVSSSMPGKVSVPITGDAPETRQLPVNDHHISKTLDGTGIRQINIDVEVCRLLLEPASDNTFAATFSYPDILAANYEKHFTLNMEKENEHTLKISTVFDDQGFDLIEGFDYSKDYPAGETLTLKIPRKTYDAVKLNLTAIMDQPLAFDIDTKELEIKAVAVDLSLQTDRVFDRLAIDLYAGNIDLQLKELSKVMNVDVSVGRCTLSLPAEPTHVDLRIKNKESFAADNSIIYELPGTWQPTITGNVATYARGNAQNKINVNNKQYGIFTVNIGNKENQPGMISSAFLFPGANQGKVEKEIPQIIADINDTQYGRNHRTTTNNTNTFSASRIDVMNGQGDAGQAMVFTCTGTDSYRKPFDQALKQLSAAYTGHQGQIVGYLDLIRNNSLRNYTAENFFAIQKVTLTGANGLQQDAYVVAVCGSDEFTKPYDEFFDTLMKSYEKNYD